MVPRWDLNWGRPESWSHSLLLNTVLILIRPCATQSKSARFRCFFFLLYFTTCFGLTRHYQVYEVCARSLLCFPFDVLLLGASTCFILVMLRHVFVSNHVFGLRLLTMLLSFPLVLYLFCLVLRVFRVSGSVYGKHAEPSRADTIPVELKATIQQTYTRHVARHKGMA
jgi:hypothetical protein